MTLEHELPASANIAGYTVELERCSDPGDPERGEWVDCWVHWGPYSASLACLEGEGCLYDADRVKPVSGSVIDRIRAYAERHGY